MRYLIVSLVCAYLLFYLPLAAIFGGLTWKPNTGSELLVLGIVSVLMLIGPRSAGVRV
jgi:hypothetical protein